MSSYGLERGLASFPSLLLTVLWFDGGRSRTAGFWSVGRRGAAAVFHRADHRPRSRLLRWCGANRGGPAEAPAGDLAQRDGAHHIRVRPASERAMGART